MPPQGSGKTALVIGVRGLDVAPSLQLCLLCQAFLLEYTPGSSTEACPWLLVCGSVGTPPPPPPSDLELSANCLRAWAGITESRSSGTGVLRGCYRLARTQLQADSRETRPHGGWFEGCHAHAAPFPAWQLVLYGTMVGSPCSPCCLWPLWPSLR